ncbi:hypothetical protein [Labilithrix luteola]|nr:hypothetical protein [Labilithrix luteola]
MQRIPLVLATLGIALVAACAIVEAPAPPTSASTPADAAPPSFTEGDAASPAPTQSPFSFEPLPFDQAPSMLAVVGDRPVYAVLASEKRLWLRTGSHYFEGHKWGPAVSFEHSGATFRALHGYDIPFTSSDNEPPRVYVAESDATLRPITPEGIGAPVEFCTAPTSCRTTADVVSVTGPGPGPTHARGAVWMVRDPEGIAFYTEESSSRLVRTALAPIGGTSRLLELVDDPPGVATAIEHDGKWTLVRLAADAATVRDEVALPEGFQYVHLARGATSGSGQESHDALHVLVAGAEGGEAALQLSSDGPSLSWHWRASVSAEASWYRRLSTLLSGDAYAGCYVSGTDLFCRDSKGEPVGRTPSVLAASSQGDHVFALVEVTAGKYAADVAAYFGPIFP